MKNKKIFITGGAGYLGKNLISKFYENNEITCYSRDEAKHYFLKKKFPKINCVVGDVRDFFRLKRCSQKHDIGIFAASLKQISACDENPIEAMKVIVEGAINSRMVAEDNSFEAACFISSDKACAATTIYGACKFVAEQSFIIGNKTETRLSSCRYGNVINSTGSIIPLIKNAIENKYTISLYSEEMTRFMLSVDDAISLIERSLTFNEVTLIPEITSFKIKDLFDIYSENFGLEYNISTPRVGEKLHEVMISSEEAPRVEKNGSDFVINPLKIYNNNFFKEGEYSSKNYSISKEELYQVLLKNNFFL